MNIMEWVNKCEGCDMYIDGICKKYGDNGKAWASNRYWLDRYKSLDDGAGFISENRICRKSSIFGNEYIGLTLDDIERIKNGEILHIPGEYGTFIGLVAEEEEND